MGRTERVVLKHTLAYAEQIEGGKLPYNIGSSTRHSGTTWRSGIWWQVGESSQKEEPMCNYGRFMLYGRNQHNTVKQLSSNKFDAGHRMLGAGALG